jgi:hypothetical protein
MKVNDKVQIKNLGKLYRTYDVMFERLGFKNTKSNPSRHGRSYYNDAIFTVFAVDTHPTFDNTIVAIRGEDGEELLIGSTGLRLHKAAVEFTVDQDFILAAHTAACPLWRSKLQSKFPDAFKQEDKPVETEMLKNVWYVHNYLGSDYLINYRGDGKGYGFYNGEWGKIWSFGEHRINQGARKATLDEIEEALRKEAIERGYGEDVVVKTPRRGLQKLLGDQVAYGLDSNYLAMGGSGIFEAGEWYPIAKLITVQQLEDAFGGPVYIDNDVQEF